MDVSRRTFIKTTLIGGAGVSVFGFSLGPVYAQTQGLKIERTTETRSTCPYCSVSCGVIIHTLGDKAKNAVPQVVHVEGDPDHPINRGTLCPKGASLEQEIERIRKDGVTAEEVKKAIAYSVGNREMGMQTHDSILLEYARSVYSGAGVASVAVYSDQIRKVTPQMVEDVVRKYLDPAQLRVAVVRGEKKN